MEWSTPSPVPFYNFIKKIRVTSKDAWWKFKNSNEKSEIDYDTFYIPKNNAYGLTMFVFLSLFGFSMIWNIWWLSILSIALIFITCIKLSFFIRNKCYSSISYKEIKNSLDKERKNDQSFRNF